MSDELYFQESESNVSSKLQGWLFSNKWAVATASFGLIFILAALFSLNSGMFAGDKVEVLGSSIDSSQAETINKITVEIAGQVQKPGVYTLLASDRVEQLLVSAGGLSSDADRGWIEKNLNRAAKLVDGQKIYIPKKGENSTSLSLITSSNQIQNQNGMVNINSASLKELDSLPGIGATRAQAIIDNRPYSSFDELVSKKALPKSVFEKIKDRLAI
jgi:competence protein ComEA